MDQAGAAENKVDGTCLAYVINNILETLLLWEELVDQHVPVLISCSYCSIVLSATELAWAIISPNEHHAELYAELSAIEGLVEVYHVLEACNVEDVIVLLALATRFAPESPVIGGASMDCPGFSNVAIVVPEINLDITEIVGERGALCTNSRKHAMRTCKQPDLVRSRVQATHTCRSTAQQM